MNWLLKAGYSLPAIITAGAIFYVSSLENIELPLGSISFNDLLFHCAGYFAFGMTLNIGAHPWQASRDYPIHASLILIALGMLYALSDEIHQAFVPNRTCALSDFFADSVGVILAVWARNVLRMRLFLR